MVDDCLIEDLLPFGDGCDAIPNMKAAIMAISKALCTGCAKQVADDVDSADFIEVGWGSEAEVPPQCDALIVQRENGQTFMSFDQGDTWVIIYDPTTGSQPERYRNGLRTWKPASSSDLFYVDAGEIVVRGVRVVKKTVKTLNVTTAADYILNATADVASQMFGVYCNEAGDIKLHNALPNYSYPETANRVFTGLVNQATWNGTNGLGLNAGSIIYDNEVGDGSIVPGMLLGIYDSTDTDYSLGRGRRSAAASSKNDASFVVITGINTGTKTITVDTNIGIWGHNIAIQNNDRLIAIQPGELMYRQESGVWWRLIDVLTNDNPSPALINGKRQGYSNTLPAGGGGTSTTSTTAVEQTGSFLHRLFLRGGTVMVGLSITMISTAFGMLDLGVDGRVRVGGDWLARTNARTDAIALTQLISGLPPGTHDFSIFLRVNSGTVTILVTESTFAPATAMWAKEIHDD